MKKSIVVLVGLSVLSLMLLPGVSSLPTEFEVVWNIVLPRETYFIGETVTFTVTAFASTDPTLKLPAEMASVTIRNQSMVEVYQGWITTNANGSAPVQYDIELTSDAGNYTIILDPLNGDNVVEEFGVLYNEETYWKERVNQLEDEINKQYEYINYLFQYNNYLTKRVKWVTDNFTIMWLMVFFCILIGMYCGMSLAVNQPASAKGILAAPGRLLKLLGISSESPLYLQHEEVAQVNVPTEKMPPISGHDYVCEICLKKGLPTKKMTRKEFNDHLWAHDRVALKRDSVMAHLRAWLKRRDENANKPEPEPTPTHGTTEEYAEGELKMDKVAGLKTKVKSLRKLQKKGLISEENLMIELKKLRQEKEKLSPSKMPDTRQTAPSPKPELTRKVGVERANSGPKIPPLEVPQKNAPPRSPIDELYDKLNDEKVK